MPDTQPKETSRVIPMTVDDLIYIQLKDFKDEFRDTRLELFKRIYRLDSRLDDTREVLCARIYRLDDRLNDTREALCARIDRLANKLDALSSKIDSLKHER